MKLTRQRNEDAKNVFNSLIDKHSIVIVYQAYLQVYNEHEAEKLQRRIVKTHIKNEINDLAVS